MMDMKFKVLLIAGMLIALMGLISGAVRRGALRAEWGRKLLHVGMGAITLSFPWLIGSSAPVLVLALLAGTWLLAVRFSPRLMARFGSALHAVDRPSWGEVYFAAGTAISYLLAGGDAMRFVLPMGVLTFADSAAAFAGARPMRRHPIGIHGKSWEGCAAFFAVSLLLAFAALSVGTQAQFSEKLSVAVQLAFDTTALELIGTRGADNLLIPIGAGCLLPLLLNASPVVPALHLGLAAMLMVLWCTPRSAALGAL